MVVDLRLVVEAVVPVLFIYKTNVDLAPGSYPVVVGRGGEHRLIHPLMLTLMEVILHLMV